MPRPQAEAVLGHEISHVANGDMVTLALLQGVLNTFVIFLARIIGGIVDRAIFRNDREESGVGFFVATMIAQIVLGIFASMIVSWYSRRREVPAFPHSSLPDQPARRRARRCWCCSERRTGGPQPRRSPGWRRPD